MDESWARMCVGKIRHETREKASAHLRALARAQRARQGRLNVYRCPICLTWHVGHRRWTRRP
ncbi:hypothetical protein [Nonomuraea bangladeshensis]|uniref:hypothetical protein n=1 Tax=Nonomuraea bangladeshensis TaxID=404385 RepID=UPI003C2E72EB